MVGHRVCILTLAVALAFTVLLACVQANSDNVAAHLTSAPLDFSWEAVTENPLDPGNPERNTSAADRWKQRYRPDQPYARGLLGTEEVPVYISLAVCEHRVGTLAATLESLLFASTVLPDHIFVFVSADPLMLDKGMGADFGAVTSARSLMGLVRATGHVTIVAVPNIGPHRKLVPLAWRLHSAGKDAVIVTVDDDELYAPDFLELLLRAHVQSGQNAVAAYRAKNIGFCIDDLQGKAEGVDGEAEWRLASYTGRYDDKPGDPDPDPGADPHPDDEGAEGEEDGKSGSRAGKRHNGWPLVRPGSRGMFVLPTGNMGVLYRLRLLDPAFLFAASSVLITSSADDVAFRLSTLLQQTDVAIACPGEGKTSVMCKGGFSSTPLLNVSQSSAEKIQLRLLSTKYARVLFHRMGAMDVLWSTVRRLRRVVKVQKNEAEVSDQQAAVELALRKYATGQRRLLSTTSRRKYGRRGKVRKSKGSDDEGVVKTAQVVPSHRLPGLWNTVNTGERNSVVMADGLKASGMNLAEMRRRYLQLERFPCLMVALILHVTAANSTLPLLPDAVLRLSVDGALTKRRLHDLLGAASTVEDLASRSPVESPELAKKFRRKLELCGFFHCDVNADVT